ncbi:unnamed protein product [Didymodactylos carnosus]|uniref:Uncharacterized protein n=1 Tax=Didymodactylos carnosus TaxID=1234261 RepID=A0A814WS69_9BILA|nr:unnamed protein product [Didymodactylos carnosus]CAF3970654.1 unnamed protein product [Didymodactylos carnosus]
MPFVERARLLSLLPRTWKYDQIKATFNCSDHAIKTAHKMLELEQYMIKLDNQKYFRQKAVVGRGRSLMLSDFLVCHPSGPFLTLSQTEFKKAVQKYPSLKEEHGVNYIENSASASIRLGKDAYFTSETILKQFERVGQLLNLKRTSRDKRSRSWSITPGRTQQSITVFTISLIPCHFEHGPNVGKTKGLLELAKDLNVNVPAGCLLPELRDLLSQHPAFKTSTKLKQLGIKYKMEVGYFRTGPPTLYTT